MLSKYSCCINIGKHTLSKTILIMKILSPEQIRQADAQTIAKQGISSWELMERASDALFSWILKQVDSQKRFVIFCGVGNNGGDGLALARKLSQNQNVVEVVIVSFSEHSSPNFLKNLKLLEQTKVSVVYLTEKKTQVRLDYKEETIIIDAIFGIGLSKPPTSWIQNIFYEINSFGAYTISIDMPSGLYANKANHTGQIFVKPHMLLTFQLPKLAFLLPETGRFVPNWEILDIGLDASYLDEAKTDFYYLTSRYISEIYQPRNRFSHKGTFGHALLVGGSYGKIGALVLSASAALRSGVGLLTLLAPKCGYNILQTAVPEAMVLTSEQDYVNETTIPFVPSAIGVGIGLGVKLPTEKALFSLFEDYPQTPFVIDADALNILSKNPDKLKLIPKNAILTPHPKELERLLGPWENDFDKIEKARTFAQTHKIILVIKGAYTLITDGAKFWFNSTGNPGMSSGGSGDVLTGILTGLLAQGYSPLEAVLLGVFRHGEAADHVSHRKGQEALIARDLIEALRIDGRSPFYLEC